jgi:hypothetical protein
VSEESGQAAPIPQILTIHWAWLLLAEMAISFILSRVHHGDDSPAYVLGGWSLLQAGWLRRMDARSTAIYWYAIPIVLTGVLFLLGLMAHLPAVVNDVWSTALLVIWVAGIFIFRRDMQRYFNTTDNVGLGLWMSLFFNAVYFQYHFHDIAAFKRRQRRLAEGSLSA